MVTAVAWFGAGPVSRALDRLAFVVFGQRAPGAKKVGWVPGSGGHGSDGGQVPPYVPYDPDRDPERRIPWPPQHRSGSEAVRSQGPIVISRWEPWLKWAISPVGPAHSEAAVATSSPPMAVRPDSL